MSDIQVTWEIIGDDEVVEAIEEEMDEEGFEGDSILDKEVEIFGEMVLGTGAEAVIFEVTGENALTIRVFSKQSRDPSTILAAAERFSLGHGPDITWYYMDTTEWETFSDFKAHLQNTIKQNPNLAPLVVATRA